MPLPGTSQKESEYSTNGKVEYDAARTAETEKGISGQTYELELHIMPPVDLGKLSVLKRQLLQIPNLQVLGEGGSNSGLIWFEVTYSEPPPIEGLLRKMSSVKEITRQGNYITISLND